ncbi:MAG: GAF domain-containing protein [Anaerolineae bacterium]|nr:GAF domain-containing protein [Anaerolineae bacterium]
MSDAQRAGRDLDMSLTNARQTLALLKSQVQAGHIDPIYFIQRFDSLGGLLEELTTERQGRADAARFAKLYEVSRAIGSSLDLEVVLNQVMDAIIALTGAERGFLMLLNDDGALTVHTARNFDQETLESDEVVVSRTITRQVFETGNPVVTTNAAEDPRYAGQASIVANQLRSIMAAPLRARGSIIGVIYVDNRVRTGLFRESDLELLEAFAGQAGVAIDNARLFRETDKQLAQRVEELTVLQWVDRQLNENLDTAKAMQIATEWAMRMAGAQSVSLAMLNPEVQELEVMSRAGQHRNNTETQHLGILAPVLNQVLDSGQAALHSYEADRDGFARTLLVVPIRRESQTIGVLIVEADRDNAFDEEAQALIARLGDRAAIAIENARLYNEVKRANQVKSEFIGVVAHELKNPMTSISGYADLMLQMSQLPDREMTFVQRIRDSVTRMQQLVLDLSDISRIESGNLRVETTDTDLWEVIDQARSSVLTEIEERGHTLREDLSDHLPIVRVDPARTVQILINLLSNAAKYTPDGGEITISAHADHAYVLVSVRDTGIGMTPEELRKLGTRFWRASNNHVGKQRGTGLGFSITRTLIEAMHATLHIESEPGAGSVFTVGLPVSRG